MYIKKHRVSFYIYVYLIHVSRASLIHSLFVVISPPVFIIVMILILFFFRFVSFRSYVRGETRDRYLVDLIELTLARCWLFGSFGWTFVIRCCCLLLVI